MSTVILVGIIVAAFGGLLALCLVDPAGHYAAEVRRRKESAP